MGFPARGRKFTVSVPINLDRRDLRGRTFMLNAVIPELDAGARSASPNSGEYRTLASAERPLLQDHLLRLAPDDRALRFLSEVSVDHIEQYCSRVDEHYRIVVGYFVDGIMRGAGEIVFNVGPSWLGSCEVALSVERACQNGGVGSELLRRLLLLARNRGVSKVRMLCMRSNRRMQRLAKKFKGELHFAAGDVEGTLYPRWPDAATLFEESWQQGCAMLNLVFGAAPLATSVGDEKPVANSASAFIID